MRAITGCYVKGRLKNFPQNSQNPQITHSIDRAIKKKILRISASSAGNNYCSFKN